MTRFEKLIQEMADVSLSWEYAGGDFIAPDATAHLAEIERLRSELAAERARARALALFAIENHKAEVKFASALLLRENAQDHLRALQDGLGKAGRIAREYLGLPSYREEARNAESARESEGK